MFIKHSIRCYFEPTESHLIILFKIHFNIIFHLQICLPNCLVISNLFKKTVSTMLLLYTCSISYPADPICVKHTEIISWRVQIICPHYVMSLVLCYSSHPRSNILQSTSLFNALNLWPSLTTQVKLQFDIFWSFLFLNRTQENKVSVLHYFHKGVTWNSLLFHVSRIQTFSSTLCSPKPAIHALLWMWYPGLTPNKTKDTVQFYGLYTSEF